MKLREYIINLYQQLGVGEDSNKQVYEYYDTLRNEGLLSEDVEKDSFKRYCRNIRQFVDQKNLYSQDSENDVANFNTKLHRENQRLKDLRRIETKEVREQERIQNALLEVNNELIKQLEKQNLTKFTKEYNVKDSTHYGIINLSDLHLNELVNAESISNKYDFNIASQRLKKLAHNSKKLFSQYKIKTVLLALTGDMLNSDKRLDEMLSMATNRTQATLLSCYLLAQFILDLNKNFNIKIASVVGNESRVNPEYAFTELIASDSYDVMIHNILKIMFKDCKGIEFIGGGIIEKVVSLDEFNILLLHGDKLNQSSLERSIHSKMAKYSQQGISIDYVIFGHLHESRISDFYARSSSLVGSNSYSDEGLNLISKASQNIFIVDSKAKDIHAIKVDLQNVNDIIGYNIIKELEAYNAKALDKLKDNKVIVQVII